MYGRYLQSIGSCCMAIDPWDMNLIFFSWEYHVATATQLRVTDKCCHELEKPGGE